MTTSTVPGAPRLAALLALPLAAPLADIGGENLVLEGDLVPGIGFVTGIENLAVNDAGQWLVEADTDADPSIDGIVVRDGVLWLRQGDALAEPAGATLSTATSPLIPFDNMSLNAAGEACLNLTLENTVGGSVDNAGVYLDANLVLQKGSVIAATGFGPGTVLGTPQDVKLHPTADGMLLVALVDDPNVAGTSDWAIMLLALTPGGDLASIIRIAGEGDVLPGQVDTVNTIRSGAHASAFNASGDVMFGADLNGPTTNDAVVYLNSTVVAQEGMPSPVVGRNWGDVISPELALNDAGDWAIKDRLDSTDTSTDDVIVVNGAKFVQAGDTLPAIGAGNAFTYFGNGPVCLTDAGDVLWFGEWDDGDNQTPVGRGLFLNDRLVVEAGVTVIDGVLLDAVGFQSEDYEISPSGRWLAFVGTLENGLEGAFLLDLQGLPVPYCDAVPNSTGVAASMSASGSVSVAANDLVLIASDVPASNNGLFFYGPAQAANPVGNGIVCVGDGGAGFLLRLPAETASPGGVMTHALDLTMPPHPSGQIFQGVTAYFSCWFRDPAAGGSLFNFANGLCITFAP